MPEHQAALYLDQTFSEGQLRGFGIAGGARYLSGASGDGTEVFAIPTATLFDASVRYDLGAASPRAAGLPSPGERLQHR